jgi:hypothetical protein
MAVTLRRIDESRSWTRAWRAPLLGLLTATALLPLTQLVVSANSPAPVAPTTGSMVVNSDGSKTLTVQGNWSFPSQTGDCNTTARAAGYAIDWNDSTQPGNTVGTVGSTTVDVGAAAPNSRNPADNSVHPTPVTSFAGAWGGCGTYNAANDYNSGTWGPISHKYPSTAGPSFTICAVTYDVHLDANGGQPKDTQSVTAGGSGNNADNSTKGDNTTPATAGCQSVTPSTATIPEAPGAALFGLLGLSGGAVLLARRGRRAAASQG